MNSTIIDGLNNKGFVQFECPSWHEIKERLVASMLSPFAKKIDSLERLHEVLSPSEVNSYRLKQISQINSSQEGIEEVIEPFWPLIKDVIGQDCLRQKRINLVVHLPEDESSIIPIHSDVKTGNSSFELGLWIPLTRCLENNTMWILPLSEWREQKRAFPCEINNTFEPILTDGEKVLLFKHFLPHGNNLNTSSQTRVSLNIRFKGLFSPENKKSSLDYYTLWKISEYTKQALNEWEEE